MKKLLQMKFMLLLCALIVGSGTMWADKETITLSAQGYENAETVSSTAGTVVTLTYTDGGNATAYYNTGNGVRVYAGGKMTVTASDNTITKVVVTHTQEKTPTISWSSNGNTTTSTTSTPDATWEGSATSVDFNVNSKGHARIQAVEVTYTTSGGGDTPTTWTVTYNGNGATSGTVPVDNTEYNAQNNTVTVLGKGDLAKTGYSFYKWNTQVDGEGTYYDPDDIFTISANTTLYAQWEINFYDVTLPEQNQYGTYTMDATNPVDYGTEVTLTYTPATGYENYVATWSVNGTAIEGNKFTMPDETVIVTVSVEEKTTTDMTIDFESDATEYTDWTFTNIVSNYTNSGVTAHGDSKYGSTDGKATGSIQTKEKVNPASLTCYVSKQSTNTTTSTWYIQVSSDGSTWTNVSSTDATDMSKGEWKKFTTALSNYSDVYVRVSYSGSTAVRLIDDLTLEIANDERLEPTVTIHDTFITNTDVYVGTAAGSLSATVTYNNEAIDGASVTWSGDNDEVATIDETTGAVTLVAAGTVTFTAAYAGNDVYKAKTATYEITVTTSNPNAHGTENNPYTVAQARAAIDANAGTSNVYVKGIVCTVSTFSTDGYITYWISDDGTTTDRLQVYKGRSFNGEDFTSAADILEGDKVTVYGSLTKYNNTYEFGEGSQLVSLFSKPTFSPEAGTYTSAQTVTISAAEGATIYYTTDGTTDPTTESTQYTEPIEVSTTTTIKAIAVKDSEVSDVATAEYIINLTPVIALDETEIEAPYTQIDGTIGVTYTNLTPSYESLYVKFYDEDDNEINDCDWMNAEISENDLNTLKYFITTNDGDEDRTAYLRVCYAEGTTVVESDLITVTQAHYVEYVTYSLAKDIKPGKHYIIVGKNSNSDQYYAMGEQGNNNRAAGNITDNVNNDGTISIAKDGSIIEFFIDMDDDYYTIYDEDETTGGYLYAASNSNNHLKTQAENDANGKWAITIDSEGVATVVAQGSNSHNEMRFNFSNKIFSCYNANNNQQDIYLYENDNELVIPIAAACTDGTKCYSTFSSSEPFVVPEGLTVSEIEILSDGTMNVVSYDTGDVVPESRGVMVSAAEGGNYLVNVSDYSYADGLLGEANALRPSTDDGFTAEEMEGETDCKFYRLTMHNVTKLGFWYGAKNGGGFNIAANKAYLAVPADLAGAREGFAFDDDSTTGISNVNVNENVNGSVFDLQGRKVSTPGKGLYIVNGKKVVIK